MSTIRCLVLLLSALLTLASPAAFAQGQGAPGSASASSATAEIDKLEADLDKELAELSTADCVLACKALESMSRSAERICELAPGPRCDAARGKVDSASERVRNACPDCAAATKRDFRTQPKPGVSEEPVKLKGEADDDDDDEEMAADAAPASAPPSEDAGAAGCAACTIGERRSEGGAALALLLMLGLALLRRRQR